MHFEECQMKKKLDIIKLHFYYYENDHEVCLARIVFRLPYMVVVASLQLHFGFLFVIA